MVSTPSVLALSTICLNMSSCMAFLKLRFSELPIGQDGQLRLHAPTISMYIFMRVKLLDLKATHLITAVFQVA